MTTFESSLRDLTAEAYEHGLGWARSSASLMLSAEDQRVLEDAARSLAQRAACSPFNPNENIEDWHADAAHEKVLSDKADAEMAQAQAAYVVGQREDERARLGADPSPPRLPPWMTRGGAALFAMTFAVGVFDWIHERLDDPYLAALVALVPAAGFGMFVVHALASAESPAERRVGFIAGIGLSAAAGLLRYSLTPDEPLVAVSITLIELFVVLFLDWHGNALQARYGDWRAGHEARAAAGQLLDAARGQERRAADLVTQLAEKSAAHLREVARRSLLSGKAAEIEAAVVKAILAGAHQGIAENVGLRRGVRPAAVREAVQ